MSFEVGQIVDGRVDGITNFGAFVDIGHGKTGLVHISEVATEYVKDIHTFLKVGQQVRVKIVSMEQGGKMALSIKKAILEERAVVPHKPMEIDWSQKSETGDTSFEDKMQRFKHDSDERMQSLKRTMDIKRANKRNNG